MSPNGSRPDRKRSFCQLATPILYLFGRPLGGPRDLFVHREVALLKELALLREGAVAQLGVVAGQRQIAEDVQQARMDLIGVGTQLLPSLGRQCLRHDVLDRKALELNLPFVAVALL